MSQAPIEDLVVGMEVRVLLLDRAPRSADARVTRITGNQLGLALWEGVPARVGGEAVVETPHGIRFRARVQGAGPASLALALRQRVEPEKREYPRFDADLELRYRVASRDAVEAWLAGEAVDLPEWTARPPVEASATGLCFEVDQPVRPTDVMLLTLGVPGVCRDRCVGRVVRVEEPAGAGVRRVAVALERIPTRLTAALVQLTLRVQDDWLAPLDNK